MFINEYYIIQVSSLLGWVVATWIFGLLCLCLWAVAETENGPYLLIVIFWVWIESMVCPFLLSEDCFLKTHFLGNKKQPHMLIVGVIWNDHMTSFICQMSGVKYKNKQQKRASIINGCDCDHISPSFWQDGSVGHLCTKNQKLHFIHCKVTT